MNTINYKVFVGTVAFSMEDDGICGKIMGIHALVTYEAQSVDELKAAFQEAVEDYIDLCKRVGKEPL